MKRSGGIENPAFLSLSPYSPRRVSAAPANTKTETSRPPEPPKHPKSREPPPPAAAAPDSGAPSGSESRSESEGPCGWGSFRPQCLQFCNTPQGFLVHYCLLALTQGKVWRPLRGARGRGCGRGWGAGTRGEAAPAADSQGRPPTVRSSAQTSTF